MKSKVDIHYALFLPHGFSNC